MGDAIDVRSIWDWALDGAPPHAAAAPAIEEFCQRLVAAGIPLCWAMMHGNTLHPNVLAGGFIWRPGKAVEIFEYDHGWRDSPEYRRSLVHAVVSTDAVVRRRLTERDCPRDIDVLSELAKSGATDVVAMPLRTGVGTVHAAAWAVDCPGGFSDAMLRALEELQRPLARISESFVQRRVTINLLNTYIGRNAAERVLRGTVRRGDVEAIEAVIWFSDLRGSTRWAKSLPGRDYIALLNEHFDCLVPAIEAEGGEVLKYIGDGILAIFPMLHGDRASACHAAIRAEAEARRATRACNFRRSGKGLKPMAFGLALHAGEVLYGNVGAQNRLDFTVTGAAINLAARLGALAADLGRETVMSADCAGACTGRTESLGSFSLRGLENSVEVYALRQLSDMQEPVSRDRDPAEKGGI